MIGTATVTFASAALVLLLAARLVPAAPVSSTVAPATPAVLSIDDARDILLECLRETSSNPHISCGFRNYKLKSCLKKTRGYSYTVQARVMCDEDRRMGQNGIPHLLSEVVTNGQQVTMGSSHSRVSCAIINVVIVLTTDNGAKRYFLDNEGYICESQQTGTIVQNDSINEAH